MRQDGTISKGCTRDAKKTVERGADHHVIVKQCHHLGGFLFGLLHRRPHDLQEDDARVTQGYDHAIDGHEHMQGCRGGGHGGRDACCKEDVRNVYQRGPYFNVSAADCNWGSG